MEAAGQVASAFNWRVLKEPRGFIKFIEFIIAIFAFATTTSFRGTTSFSVPCDKSPQVVSYDYSYPFDLTSVGFKIPICNKTEPQSDVHLGQGAVAPAQFYVFVGVMAFLYCIGALILYTFFDDLYRKNTKIVVVDFVISTVLTALWLISSSAWAQGVSDVKYYTDPNASGLFKRHDVTECTTAVCPSNNTENWASLNVSLIFGFLNFGVWAGNLWFLYKETPWFKIRSKPPSTPAGDHQEPPTNQY